MSALRLLHEREEGQSAFLVILSLLVVVALFALSLDAGVWYFDHREAQNEAEAAALAAVLELPSADTQAAIDAADEYLVKNGASATTQSSCPLSGTGSGIEFADLTGDGEMDSVTVCIRRSSAVIFSAMSGVTGVRVSASATARIGAVNHSNIMPWAVVAPDPTCTEDANRNCLYDAKGDGDYTDPGDCNDVWTKCPFGVTEDRLFAFKQGTGGNTGILRVCGPGADDYRECLSGENSSGIYEEGDDIVTDLQGGTIANATDVGLQNRAPGEAWDLPTGAQCDVQATPLGNDTQSPGYDPDGKDLAYQKFVSPAPIPECAWRLVPVPIIDYLPPNGGGTVTLLGFAVFGVAKWNSTASQDRYIGNGTQACFEGPNNPNPSYFRCGIVWGYIFSGVMPPDALLSQIGNSNNPFAPLLIALVD